MEEEKAERLPSPSKRSRKSLLGFLPVEARRAVIFSRLYRVRSFSREATPIICMLCCMFCLLLIGGNFHFSTAERADSPEGGRCKAEKEYLEKLFGTFGNIDFAFMLYTLEQQKVEAGVG